MKSIVACVLALTAGVGSTTGMAAAAAPAAGGLEEITVTARKREETLQEIPLSVTAFTATDMARRNIQDM